MTEDTSPSIDRLYVWVTNWDKFQGRTDRAGLPWFKVYSDLFRNDDFLELSNADRCLLIGLWSDTNTAGQGRVSGNLTALRGRHNARRASLDRLVQAGFITLSTTKGAPLGHHLGKTEESTTYSLKKRKDGERAHEDAAENGASRTPEETETLRAELEAIRQEREHPNIFTGELP